MKQVTYFATVPMLLLVLTLLVGCGSTSVSQYGDARLKRTERVTTFDLMLGPKVVHELDFPPVSLSRPGTTTYKVRGIKPGMVPNEVTLRYPQESSLCAREMSDQW